MGGEITDLVYHCREARHGYERRSAAHIHRNGGDHRTIWPGRVLAYWTFDSTDPQVSPHVEPDLTGNGHNLTYIHLGTSREHTYAQFVTPTNPPIVTPSPCP